MRRFVRLIVSNGMVSLVSMMLTFAVSRSGGLEALGQFAVGYAVLSLTQVLVREMCLNVAMRHAKSVQAAAWAVSRAVVIVIPVAVGVAIWGIYAQSALVMALSFAIPAFSIYDFLRFWTASSQVGVKPLIGDLLIGATVTLGFVATEVYSFDAAEIVFAWGLSLSLGACLLYFSSPLFRFRSWNARFDRSTCVFGVQGLFGAGSVHVAFFVLGVFFSPSIVGALRGATTFSGPGNLVTSTVQGGAISPISATKVGSSARKRAMFTWAALAVSVNAPLLVLTAIVAAHWGNVLLGDAWHAVAPLVPWILLDAGINSLVPATYAAHRADNQAKRVLVIALVCGVLRISMLSLAALIGGVVVVSLALVGVSLVSVTALWVSYAHYSKRAQRAIAVDLRGAQRVLCVREPLKAEAVLPCGLGELAQAEGAVPGLLVLQGPPPIRAGPRDGRAGQRLQR